MTNKETKVCVMIDIAMQGVRVERKEYKIKIYKDWRRVRFRCSVVPVALELFPSGLPHTRFWSTLANTKSGDFGNGPAIEKRFWSQRVLLMLPDVSDICSETQQAQDQ